MSTRSIVLVSGWLASTALVGVLAACGSDGSGTPGPNGPAEAGLDTDAALDAGTGAQDGSTGQDAGGGGDTGAQSNEGGPAKEGGPSPGDGGEGGADGGPRDIGSCCSVQTTPGCDDPNVEVCVCEKDPTCCTAVWAVQCTYIVQQKYCQLGVRDCVCGTDAGEWAQTQCCSTDWSSTCDSVATLKCGAAQGCF